MRRYKIIQLTGGLLFTIVFFSATAAQRASVKNQAPVKPRTTPQRQSTASDDSWWAAQRNLEGAIVQLEKYLRDSPNGPHAPTARQQIAALRSLTITQSQREWVTMRTLPLPDVPLWRAEHVERLADRVRIRINIRCGRDDGGDCQLRSFARSPLVLVDNEGTFYPMLEVEPLPGDLRFARDGQALLSAGRVLSLTVDFAPLRSSATGGQIQFRDANEALPAKFSLIRKP